MAELPKDTPEKGGVFVEEQDNVQVFKRSGLGAVTIQTFFSKGERK
jgi:hypothetical protein